MYTNNEIEIIVESCTTAAELLHACLVFKYLIDNNWQKKSSYLEIKTTLRFRELEKL